MSSPTNNQPELRKIPKLANKPEYEESEYTDTNHSRYDKATEHAKVNESLLTIKDLDTFVQIKIFIKYLISLHFQNKFIQFTLNDISQINMMSKFSLLKNGTILHQFHLKTYLVHMIVYPFVIWVRRL